MILVAGATDAPALDRDERPVAHAVIERADLQALFDALSRRGYELVGPTVRDGGIIYDVLESVEDLPVGWTDEQEAGAYRLRPRGDAALFGYAVGPQSWKKYLHPPVLRLWRAQRDGQDFRVEEEEDHPPKRALIGVRACELHAIAIQDRVFLESDYVDPAYRARREQVFILAVNCGKAGGTCFCSSMNAGPHADSGFDLALTEALDDDRHYFVVDVGSPLGAAVLDETPHREAMLAEVAVAERIVAETAAHMGRTLETAGLKDLLYRSANSPRWDVVADRCLTCGNCTMVCPTCFCTTVEDVTDLTGGQAERQRRWDSCFTTDFSYIHGGSVRATSKARYRQWMTHKLASWVDQFGTAGCVGCGRCVTWCPVGIDITEEAAAIRAEAGEPAP